MKSMSAIGAVSLAVLLVVPGYSGASVIETSWIFRSEVAGGQSMWGPGNLSGYDYGDSYVLHTWPFDGTGLEWALKLQQGIVSGNVEGIVKAKYSNYSQGPLTHIDLSYAPINGESSIGSNLTANLTATPRLRFAVLPWPAPSIDWSLPLSVVNISLAPRIDYAANLGRTVTASSDFTALTFSEDVVLFGVKLDIGLDQDIWFTPNTVTGTVTFTHMDTGAVRTADVTLNTDGQPFGLDMNLDLEGHWEVRLDNFQVDENIFRQEFGLWAKAAFEIPFLGASYAITNDSYFNLFEASFGLDFLHHFDDGDATTADNLGRFSIYVNPVPEPATIVLVLSGLAIACRRRRSPAARA